MKSATKTGARTWLARAGIVATAALVGLGLLSGAVNRSPAEASTWQIGDVFAGVSDGDYQVYDNLGTFKELISHPTLSGFTTGCAFNDIAFSGPDLYGTYFSANRVIRYANAHPHGVAQTIDVTLNGGAAPESIVFAANGDFYVGHASGDRDIQKYNAAGTFLGKFNVATENVGSDWIELSVDQMTMFYTSEGRRIFRYNVATSTQLLDFATLPGSDRAFALRLLPPGDGSGGLLVADSVNVKRLNAAGVVVQTYDVTGEDSWFSLNLDPDGLSFWAGNISSGKFYRFNILSGLLLDTVDTGRPGNLFGLCLLGEPTAAVKKKTLTLTPKTAVNPVDSKHTVTAELREDGTLLNGFIVRFQVTGSVNATGSCKTGTTGPGQCTFTYTGPAFPGADLIHAYADLNNNNVQDADEPFDDATKEWILPKSDAFCEVKITYGGRITADNGDKASFGGNAKVNGQGDPQGQEEYQDHGPADPMNVHSIDVVAVTCTTEPPPKQASIFGNATIDGSGSFFYRIDVKDVNEPGKGFDTYRIRIPSKPYDSGEHVLDGGNIQIHK
jgi:hypothetical protein